MITAQDGAEAWQKFEEESPDIVVTDVRMPHRDGLSLTAQIKATQPSCPVIVVTGFGSEEAAVAALKAGASDYLVKPFQLSDLRHAVDRACSLHRDKWADECVVSVVDDVRSTLIIDNVPERLGSVVNFVLRSLNGCLSDSHVLGLRVALQELLMNAIEHGNLHITSDEKNRALMADTYDQLLHERREMPEYRHRRVRLSFSHDLTTGIIEIRIIDEGQGFDWHEVLGRDATQLPKMLGSGRGIFLVRTLIPNLSYFGNGNEVALTLSHASVQ